MYECIYTPGPDRQLPPHPLNSAYVPLNLQQDTTKPESNPLKSNTKAISLI